MAGICEGLVRAVLIEFVFGEVSDLLDFFSFDSEQSRIELSSVAFAPTGLEKFESSFEFITVPSRQHAR